MSERKKDNIIDLRKTIQNRRSQGKIKVFRPEGKVIEFPRERVIQEQQVPQENTPNEIPQTQPVVQAPEVSQPVQQVQQPVQQTPPVQQVQSPVQQNQISIVDVLNRRLRIVDLYETIGAIFRRIPIIGPLIGICVAFVVGLFDGLLFGLISIGWILIQAIGIAFIKLIKFLERV